MDILIRIIVMPVCFSIIIYIAKIITNSFNDNEKELTKKNKIYLYIFHLFFTSWFITVPGYIFINCIIYIIKNLSH